MLSGEVFKKKREAAGLSQKQAAQALFVSQPYLSGVEAGGKLPTVGLVGLAAKLYGCTTDELIYGEEQRE